ncbi:hypothetical protein BJ170DRAFT_584906 [Xylariales sp. AK1849]|nr:hypothetical protein BJ170DRAFT_584906 [Xylariales sp. AK1849]
MQWENEKVDDQPRPPALSEVPDTDTESAKQPETRPISQEQLVAEVKGIYAGLVMVESKCIEIDNAQSTHVDAKLNNEQWQALIALHRTLLHEHHDFFLASQHPSASPALRKLASKYAMPARMWRHGIHSFLELLQHRLPASLEHMLSLIYLAYSMMALLYEAVPAFEDTWIECLGDLGRYRMAIEDDDIRDREVWTSMSRHWYSKASDKAPVTGRLYHHLAILARPSALQQLFYYTKSLCVSIPFTSARESIMTLFNPLLSASNSQCRLNPIAAGFVQARGELFSETPPEDFHPFHAIVREFLDSLDDHVGRITRRWIQSGYYISIAHCCGTLSYGTEDNIVLPAIRSQTSRSRKFQRGGGGGPGIWAEKLTAQGIKSEFAWCWWRSGITTWTDHAPVQSEAMDIGKFTWALLKHMNKLVRMSRGLFSFSDSSYQAYERIDGCQIPRPAAEPSRPLPEEYVMRGLLWADQYFPDGWFPDGKIDDDEKYFEVASMTNERKEMLLWLRCRIARHEEWLTYNAVLHQFSIKPELKCEVDLDAQMHQHNNSDTSDTPDTPAPDIERHLTHVPGTPELHSEHHRLYIEPSQAEALLLSDLLVSTVKICYVWRNEFLHTSSNAHLAWA